jgi:hypothetical protein
LICYRYIYCLFPQYHIYNFLIHISKELISLYQFNPATLLCTSQPRTWISNVICRKYSKYYLDANNQMVLYNSLQLYIFHGNYISVSSKFLSFKAFVHLRRLILVTYASSQWRGKKFLIEHVVNVKTFNVSEHDGRSFV